MGLREQKKRKQRQEILDAALWLFRERGYDETRVQDIAELANVSEATFFNYFPTKEALLHEFAFVLVDLYAAGLEHELRAERVPVPDRVRELMRAAARAAQQDRDFQAVVYTRSNFYRAHGLLKERELRMYELLAQLFRVGQERGEIRTDRQPMLLAEGLTAIHHLVTVNWLTGWWGETEPLEERLLEAVDVFLAGCAPPARQREGRPNTASPRRGG